MKLSSLILLFCLISQFLVSAQVALEDHKWYKLIKPSFLHGQKGFSEYIMLNVKMPYKESKTEITGIWDAEYIMAKNNKLILKKVIDTTNSADLNKELLEWINISNDNWTGASINGTQIDFPLRVIVKVSTDNTFNIFQTSYMWIFTPELANQYYNEGVKMFEANNYAEAVKFFDETLFLTSKDIDALYNRGVCKFKLNDKEGACEDWKKINSLGKPDADNLISKYCN